MGFFDQPQGAAFFKHGVLKRYLTPYISKVGHRSGKHQVAYLDGYAGPGTYDDGSPGSPALALETVEALPGRDTRCYFIEPDNKNFARLAAEVASSPVGHRAKPLHGTFHDCLDEVLAETRTMPLLALLDPFGLAPAFDDIIRILRRPTLTRNCQTEVMINFVHQGLYRNAGKLDINSTDPTQLLSAATIIDRTNASLGGDWWQPVWRGPGDVPSKVARIRDEYVNRLVKRAGTGWRHARVPVADSGDGKPVYDLILFTRHRDGIWLFNEAVSLTREKFEEHFGSQNLLTPLWNPEDEWAEEIRRNILRLLERGAFVLGDRASEVYGTTIGLARGTHVRSVIKSLHASGLTATTGVGDPLSAIEVHPPARASTA